LTAVAVCAAIVPGLASAAAACAPAAHAGGEWPSYGSNMSNWRAQTAETLINPSNVASLTSDWVFSVAKAGGSGAVQSTSAISGGCLYVATANGYVYAVNADTGETVWGTLVSKLDQLGSGISMFAPSVADGRVHVLGNTTGAAGKPMAAALDATTGAILWKTDLIDKDAGIFDAASAVVSNGLVFAATTYGDTGTDPTSRPPFWILDATNGEILKKTRVISDEDGLQGYAGGGIWSTAAVDQTTKYLYVGTANPYSRRQEHKYTNAVIKVDFDRTRSTFGEVVGSYKGNPDSDPALVNTPQCQLLGDVPLAAYSLFCGQYDVDMAASPQLFTNSAGRRLVGILQKSGIYHVADADTMAPVWKSRLAPWYGAGGHSATAAFDGRAIYVNTDQGKLDALDRDTGRILWTANYDDAGGKYQPVTVANGVVYVLHHLGTAHAFDALTGQPLATLAPSDASGVSCGATSGAGVSVARNTVWVSCDGASDGAGAVFAMRLP
jgi:polyvinyl alcohol dehydrogenase (cytochrome)